MIGTGLPKSCTIILSLEAFPFGSAEKDIVLGASLLREIDKGLANSRVGIVLVTPAFLRRVEGRGYC